MNEKNPQRPVSESTIIRSISAIYDRVQIPQNLRVHMLDAASVGALVCANWRGPKISEKKVVATLLVHDLANIIKFDMGRRGILLMTAADRKSIDFWRAIKAEATAKYGNDAEEAVVKMAKDLNLSNSVVSLLEKMSAVHSKRYEIGKVLRQKDRELAICLYADWRVNPRGIVSIAERAHDLSIRYNIRANEIRKLHSEASMLEEWLFRNVKLSPAEINSSSARRYLQMFNSGKFILS
ncbi:MAG: hypothetical protein ABSE71_02375 [Candidatus Micrarchaeaceae archaeon]|jgi:5'-deoxynucleotidase YfbR-like HD superfamily hydrolase|nr:hypothetical protein [Candidatus Micrarchaeota archaeon]HII10117.1 hypothetical protein [Candidatus Micrarchaeota archaeon]